MSYSRTSDKHRPEKTSSRDYDRYKKKRSGSRSRSRSRSRDYKSRFDSPLESRQEARPHELVRQIFVKIRTISLKMDSNPF